VLVLGGFRRRRGPEKDQFEGLRRWRWEGTVHAHRHEEQGEVEEENRYIRQASGVISTWRSSFTQYQESCASSTAAAR